MYGLGHVDPEADARGKLQPPGQVTSVMFLERLPGPAHHAGRTGAVADCPRVHLVADPRVELLDVRGVNATGATRSRGTTARRPCSPD